MGRGFRMLGLAGWAVAFALTATACNETTPKITVVSHDDSTGVGTVAAEIDANHRHGRMCTRRTRSLTAGEADVLESCWGSTSTVQVTLYAEAPLGSEFVGWGGDCAHAGAADRCILGALSRSNDGFNHAVVSARFRAVEAGH